MSEIWKTKDGRYAISMPGERHATYPTFAAAEIALAGMRSLGNFLNMPITGDALARWFDTDRAMRAEHEVTDAE